MQVLKRVYSCQGHHTAGRVYSYCSLNHEISVVSVSTLVATSSLAHFSYSGLGSARSMQSHGVDIVRVLKYYSVLPACCLGKLDVVHGSKCVSMYSVLLSRW